MANFTSRASDLVCVSLSVTSSNKEEITSTRLNAARIVVLGGPQEKFSGAEFEALRQYLSEGGSVMVLMGEGGESKLKTNINFLLEEYGICVNPGKASSMCATYCTT